MKRLAIILAFVLAGCNPPVPPGFEEYASRPGCQWRFTGQPAGFDGLLMSPDAVKFVIKNDRDAERRFMQLWWGTSQPEQETIDEQDQSDTDSFEIPGRRYDLAGYVAVEQGRKPDQPARRGASR